MSHCFVCGATQPPPTLEFRRLDCSHPAKAHAFCVHWSSCSACGPEGPALFLNAQKKKFEICRGDGRVPVKRLDGPLKDVR